MAFNLALIGGEEFSDAFEAIHAGLTAERRRKLRVAFLPTPAANDGIETVEHWCFLAREKLSVLGAIVDSNASSTVRAQMTRAMQHGTLISGVPPESEPPAPLLSLPYPKE